MATLIKILAASIGCGLMLGAGIRLGETLVDRDLPPRRNAEIDLTLAERLGALEARLVNLKADSSSSLGFGMENQAGEVEVSRSPAGAAGELDAFAEKVQTRVMNRISRLEEEVAGQSVAMTELRECALRTEQSMQKLLGGLERIIVAQPAPVADVPVPRNATVEEDAQSPDPEPPQPLEEPKMPAESKFPAEPPRKSRRWGIFG